MLSGERVQALADMLKAVIEFVQAVIESERRVGSRQVPMTARANPKRGRIGRASCRERVYVLV